MNNKTLKNEIFCTIISCVALIMSIISTLGFDYKYLHLFNSFFVCIFLIYFPSFVISIFKSKDVNSIYLSKFFLIIVGFCIIIFLIFVKILFKFDTVFLIYFLSILIFFYCFFFE